MAVVEPSLIVASRLLGLIHQRFVPLVAVPMSRSSTPVAKGSSVPVRPSGCGRGSSGCPARAGVIKQ